jgi:hypothetical protein
VRSFIFEQSLPKSVKTPSRRGKSREICDKNKVKGSVAQHSLIASKVPHAFSQQYQLWPFYLHVVVSLGEIFQNKHSTSSRRSDLVTPATLSRLGPMASRHNHHELSPSPPHQRDLCPEWGNFPECCMEDQIIPLPIIIAFPSSTISPTLALVPEFMKQANTLTNASSFQVAILLPYQITR